MMTTELQTDVRGGCSVQRLVGRRTQGEVIKARLAVAVETLEQIAALPRGGLAKRLAVSTLRFITPEPPKRFPRINCPVCGKNVTVNKRGWIRSHQGGPNTDKNGWCKANHETPNSVLGQSPANKTL